MVIQSLWLQTQIGYTAQWAGYALAPVGIFAVCWRRWSAAAGFPTRAASPPLPIIFAICFFWRAHFTTGADFITIACRSCCKAWP
jgi:DHA2 family multidrug resistance protein